MIWFWNFIAVVCVGVLMLAFGQAVRRIHFAPRSGKDLLCLRPESQGPGVAHFVNAYTCRPEAARPASPAPRESLPIDALESGKFYDVTWIDPVRRTRRQREPVRHVDRKLQFIALQGQGRGLMAVVFSLADPAVESNALRSIPSQWILRIKASPVSAVEAPREDER